MQIMTVVFVCFQCYFSCPIALASSTQLNNNGENRHPCFVTDCRGKYSFFIIQYNVNSSFWYVTFVSVL